MKGAGAAGAVHAGDGALAEANQGPCGTACGCITRPYERAEKDGQVGVVSDDEDVVVVRKAGDELVKGRDVGVGVQGFGDEDFGVIAGLSADERSGLKGALERAGDDEVKLDVESVKVAADKNALLLTLPVERAFDVNEGIRAARAGTGMAKDV